MPRRTHFCAVFAIASLLWTAFAQAQAPSSAPVALPSGVSTPAANAPSAPVSPKQAREADDAYIEGAKHIQHNDLGAAERSFARAVQLNPDDRDYALALQTTREEHVTALVQQAAKARLMGDNAKADAALAEARAIDPENPVVAQHFGLNLSPWQSSVDPMKFPAADIASTLAGPIEFAPTAGTQSFHRRGDAQDMIRTVYEAFGIKVSFDTSVTNNAQVRLDLDNVDFATATRIIAKMTHIFAVPVQPNFALVAKDNQENRDKFVPLIEETVYLPGVSSDEMTELANVARNIFDVKQVTASATGGDMLLRGDEEQLKLVNATFADMLDGGSDVQLDITLYELDKTHMVNIGAQLPNSASVFSVEQEAQNIVNANQTTLNAVLSSGQFTIPTGISQSETYLLEALALIKYAGVTDANITNLLGLVGSVSGVPLAGISLSGTSTFNLLLNSTDVRILDAVTIRGGNRQALNFRTGTRYPVVTATYSSGVSSSLLSQLAGVTVNGTSAAALAAQYLGAGATAASIPQFQFEDLGLTLKTTPQILHSNEVSLALDMKIESLAGGQLNSIPILNSRTLTSTVTVPVGQTALLASNLSTNELRSLDGLPYLSELPGFQGTDKSTEQDRAELLISITPHIVRAGNLRVASRRLATPPAGPGSQ